MDDFLTDISGLLVESHFADLGDRIDDLHLLFDEADSSLVFTRVQYNPPIHSLNDLSLQVEMIVDTYEQQL